MFQSISVSPSSSDCLGYTSVLFSQMMLRTLMFCITELLHVFVEVV